MQDRVSGMNIDRHLQPFTDDGVKDGGPNHTADGGSAGRGEERSISRHRLDHLRKQDRKLDNNE